MSQQQWTVVEKRVSEVVDIGVDWEDELIRIQEVAVVGIVWTIDLDYQGVIADYLAGVPYQPRLDGAVARARIKAGADMDTVLVCTATFTSGQVLQDKTYVKIIP